jgi:DNA-binding winged helix-turn-helix (wHTH) protein/Tol biopolymer transport system component
MGPDVAATRVYRFGLFEADVRNGRLLRHGERIKIQDQPFRVLLVLLGRAGEIITREELRQELWPSDTYVEFDGSLNAALMKLRHALGDSPDNPTFIETVPKRGYRFIAPVETVYAQPAGSRASAAGHVARELGGSAPEFTEGMKSPARANGALGLSLAPAPELRSSEPVLLPFPTRGRVGSRPRVAPLTVAIAALAMVSAAVYLLLPVSPPRVLRSVQLTHFGRADSSSDMATDGARIYFSEVKGGRYTVDQLSVAGGEPTPFPLPFPNAEVLDISPDHTELLVASFTGFERDRPLWVVPVTGGAPRRLGDAVGATGAWSPDGKTIAYGRGADLDTVNRDGDESRRLVSTPATVGLSHVRWSPSGRTLRFTVLRSAPISEWEVSADGSNLHPLPTKPETEAWGGEGYGSWTPDGRYFVYRTLEDGVFSILAKREASGVFRRFSHKPVTLHAGPRSFYSPLVSMDGKRVFFIADEGHEELVQYDPVSRQFVPYLSGIDARYVTFSKDGQQVFYTLWPDVEMWSSRTDGSDRHPMTFLPMHGAGGCLSPDGRKIAFGAWTGAPAGGGLYLLPVEADGKPEQLLTVKDGGLVGWSADGASLFFWRISDSGAPELGLYVLDLKTRHASLLPGSLGLHHGSVSPDGRYVAALRPDGKTLVLFDLRTDQQTVLAHGAAIAQPYWSRDGRTVIFQDIFQGTDQPIYRVRIDDRKVERVTNFAQPFAADVTGYRLTGVAPDSQVLAVLIRSNSDLYALDVDFP